MQYPITALDGRYQKNVALLSHIVSEYGLMKYRVAVEIHWLFFLQKQEVIPKELFFANLADLKESFSEKDYEKINATY